MPYRLAGDVPEPVVTTISREYSTTSPKASKEASEQVDLHGLGPICLGAALRSDQMLPTVWEGCAMGSSSSKSGTQITQISLQGTLSNGGGGTAGNDCKHETHSIVEIKQKTSRKLEGLVTSPSGAPV